MKKFFLIITIIIFSATLVSGKDLTVYSNDIWFSDENFFADDKIRIYSKFSNPNEFDIKEVVEFWDNEKKIGEKEVEIAHKTELTVWIDTVLNSGSHKIISKIKETEKILPTVSEKIKTDEKINLKEIKVDKDTDNDKIGDSIDPDDDNDGFTDIEEIQAGTDPKEKDSKPKKKIELKKETENNSNKEKEVVEKINLAKNIFTEKRENIALSLKEKIEKEELEKEKIKKQILEEFKKYQKEVELKLIEKYKKKREFEKKVREYKKEFEKNENLDIQNIQKKTKFNLIEVDKKNLEKEKKDFLKSCIYQAKNEKIKEVIEEKYSMSFLSETWNYILKFLWFIFKNTFLTILFLIFLFWMIWKLVKKF